MERINLADDLSFSRIVYGMWRLGDDADFRPVPRGGYHLLGRGT